MASVNEQAIAIALGHPPELDGKNLAEGIIHLGYRTQRNSPGHGLEASSMMAGSHSTGIDYSR